MLGGARDHSGIACCADRCVFKVHGQRFPHNSVNLTQSPDKNTFSSAEMVKPHFVCSTGYSRVGPEAPVRLVTCDVCPASSKRTLLQCTHPLTHSTALPLPLTHSYTLGLPRKQQADLATMHTLSHTLSITPSLTHSHSHFLILSLILSLTHCHTLGLPHEQ